jgi:hypothetical protein
MPIRVIPAQARISRPFPRLSRDSGVHRKALYPQKTACQSKCGPHCHLTINSNIAGHCKQIVRLCDREAITEGYAPTCPPCPRQDVAAGARHPNRKY